MKHHRGARSETPTSVEPPGPDKDDIHSPGVVIENLETSETKVFVYRDVLSDVEDNKQGGQESEHDRNDESNTNPSGETVGMTKDDCTESLFPSGQAKLVVDDVHVRLNIANNKDVTAGVSGNRDSLVLSETVKCIANNGSEMKRKDDAFKIDMQGSRDSLILSGTVNCVLAGVSVMKANIEVDRTGIPGNRETFSPPGMANADGEIGIVENGDKQRDIEMGASGHISAGSHCGKSNSSNKGDSLHGRVSPAADASCVMHHSGIEHDINNDNHMGILNVSVLPDSAAPKGEGESTGTNRDHLIIPDSNLMHGHVAESGQTGTIDPLDNTQMDSICPLEHESTITLVDSGPSLVLGVESSGPVFSYSGVSRQSDLSSNPVVSNPVVSITSEVDSDLMISTCIASVKSNMSSDPLFSNSIVSVKSEVASSSVIRSGMVSIQSEVDTNHETSSIHPCQSAELGDQQHPDCSQIDQTPKLSQSAILTSAIKSEYQNLLCNDRSREVGECSLYSSVSKESPGEVTPSSQTEISESSTPHALPDDLDLSTLHIEDADSSDSVHKSVNYESEYTYVMLDENLPLFSSVDNMQSIENKSDKPLEAAGKDRSTDITKSDSFPGKCSEDDSQQKGIDTVSNISSSRGRGGEEHPGERKTIPVQTEFSDTCNPVGNHTLSTTIRMCPAGVKPRYKTRDTKFDLPTIHEVVGLGEETANVEQDLLHAYFLECSNDTQVIPGGVGENSSLSLQKTCDLKKSTRDYSNTRKHVDSALSSDIDTDTLLLEVENIPAYGGAFEDNVHELSSDEDREYKLPQCTTDDSNKYRYGTYTFSQKEEDVLSKQLAKVDIVHMTSDNIPEYGLDGYRIELSDDAMNLGLNLPLVDHVVTKTDSRQRIQLQDCRVGWFSKPCIGGQNMHDCRSRRTGGTKTVGKGFPVNFNTAGLCSPVFAEAKRVKERKTYLDQELDDDDIDGKRAYRVEEKLTANTFNKKYVQNLKGEVAEYNSVRAVNLWYTGGQRQRKDFTLKFLQEHGLQYPIIFEEKTGLGLRVPSGNFKVSDVKACVGSRRMLDVMDVNTQKGMEMTMKEWTKYYENLERDRLLNVISLEFSHTRLENYVESPNLVREVDWVDTAWPQHLKDCQTESTNAIDKMKYPKVQKYCLMSVAGCYTDFHIDFGGTSVWYHILHGEKIFWLIPPTQRNISLYENWVLSGKQGEMFLGDTIEECQRISLQAGNTFIIPSGWIHAVYTPKDSLVFGGNFLHNFNMVNQLRVSAVEDRTHVPMKFRYPFYAEINWYVLERYVHSLTGITYLEKPQLSEELEVINKMEKEAPDLLEDKLLNKRVAVSLTRIDSSPRSKSTSDDDSTASGPPRSPGQAAAQSRSVRKSSSESCNSADLKLGSGEKQEKVRVPYKSPVKKKMKYVHLTKFELEGLREIVGWIESLPPNKKGIPKDLLDPETVISEIKRLIEEHLKDNPELAITGEPVLEWTKATKKLIKLKQKVKTAKLLGTLSAPKVKGKITSGSRHRRVRCKKCEPCTRDDCMECNFCKDMKKYGGPGRAKQSCISRQCLAPNLPNNVSCLICKSDRPLLRDESASDLEDSEDYSASLMECGLCWEIVHPQCLQKKYENLSEGVLNEDLPNSWKCAKCCTDGKEGHLKTRVFKGGWRPTPTSSPPPLGEASGYQSPVESIVTEGKRVTANPAIDSKPAFMEKSFSSPATMSSSIQSVKAETYSERENEKSMKPTSLPKPPSLPETKTATIKLESIKTEPVEVSGMNGSSDHSRVKAEHKRKVSPKIEEPSKKRRLLSRSPGRSSQHRSPQSSKLSSPKSPKGSAGSRSSDRGLRHAADFAMKRSKRESQHPTTSYDFDESELMDTSAPLSDRGKGRGTKGRKVVLKDSNGGLRVASNNAKVVDNADTQQGRELPITPNKSAKSSGEDLKNILLGHIEKQKLPIIPQKFVARPVTVSPPKENVDTTNGKQHPLPRKLWMKIFGYLSTDDIARCLAVCRVWNRWCINPDLWKSIDLSRKRIIQNHLMGIVRRQPECLNLSSVIMTQKQVIWLLERIPLLKHLVLSKCSWATVSGLCMSACPLLHSLDTSWASGLNAQCFEDLVTPPVDRKPAVKNISRLHRLKSLNLSGTEITDESLNLITIHMPRLEDLNISYCTRISDRGIQMLANSKSASHETLKKLNISGCRQVTESSLTVIRNFKNLCELNILYCIKIPASKCNELNMRSLKVFRW